MNKVFLDTSVVVTFFDKGDPLHDESKRMLLDISRKKIRLISTDYVLDECITTILAKIGHKIAVESVELILNSNLISMIWLDEPMLMKAWEYFKKHSDKGYSFTDCTSFVLMKEMKIDRCLSFDRHFEQAGFKNFCKSLNSD
ncbi:MAG: PIN domain-containing protein [Nitrospirae bacterium]|nr:MAG: PIN domain-containing protein [Nitrospirota bacterium]